MAPKFALDDWDHVGKEVVEKPLPVKEPNVKKEPKKFVKGHRESVEGIGVYSGILSVNTSFYYCPLALRMDTYIGCDLGCKYCFANDWMSKMYTWMGVEHVRNGDINVVKKMFTDSKSIEYQCLEKRMPIHWGGNCDPFPTREKKYNVTYDTLKFLSNNNYPVVMSSKSDIIIEDKYLKLIEGMPFIFQSSICQDIYPKLEPGAPSVDRRIEVLSELNDLGFYTVVRMEPLIVTDNAMARIDNLLGRFADAGVNHITMSRLRIFNDKLKKFFTTEEYSQILRNSYSSRLSGNINKKMTFAMSHWMRDKAHEHGLTYGAASDVDQLLSDGLVCCYAIDDAPEEFQNVLKCGQYAMARKSRDTGKPVYYADVEKEWAPKGAYMKTISKSKKKPDSFWKTTDTYLNGLWNQKKPRNFMLQDLVGMKEIGTDAENNKVYKFDQRVFDAYMKMDIEQKGLSDYV